MRIPILVVLVMSMAGTARAEGYISPLIAIFALFGEGAVITDHTSRLPESGAAVGGGGAIGFRGWEHFSVRFEMEIPTMHRQTFTRNSGGLNTIETEEFRIKTYSGLVAGHYQVHKRVDLALLAGLSAATPETRASGYYEEFRSGTIVRHDIDSRGSYRTGALTVGADVAIKLTDNLALVPEWRFHGLNDERATRVKVAIRGTFF